TTEEGDPKGQFRQRPRRGQPRPGGTGDGAGRAVRHHSRRVRTRWGRDRRRSIRPGVLEALMLAVHPSPDGREGGRGYRGAVTGVGVVAPCGIGRDAFWEGLLGKAPTGLRRVSPDFDATELYGPKEVRRVDRFTQFTAVAAAEALADAGGLNDEGGLCPDPD